MQTPLYHHQQQQYHQQLHQQQQDDLSYASSPQQLQQEYQQQQQQQTRYPSASQISPPVKWLVGQKINKLRWLEPQQAASSSSNNNNNSRSFAGTGKVVATGSWDDEVWIESWL